jgi:hypothetical protein
MWWLAAGTLAVYIKQLNKYENVNVSSLDSLAP